MLNFAISFVFRPKRISCVPTHVVMTSSLLCCRQCNSERVRYRDNDLLPYCVDGCSNNTHCGDVIVPDDHLDVCYILSLLILQTVTCKQVQFHLCSSPIGLLSSCAAGVIVK